ncbi:MAG TPA: type VI secretion system baseplate subunit TssF [Paraburkholderia sp.]|nr:type VI secretion system baseplate subunit TssF [Paraburkholderia sp.]
MTAPWKPYQQEGGNPFPRYFDAEMRYLREAGREFSHDHPDAARRLGMQYGQEDDQVRAVHEDFSMLAARLRGKLDDGMPELADGPIDDLFGHMARAIPSLSIIECTPLNRRELKTAQIPAGAVEGDAVLFVGDVLNHFLGRYASWQCSMQLARAIDGQETVYPRTNFTGALFR